MKTVCCDFDGVIHSYIKPWTRPDVIPDPPVEGAIAWLNHLADNGNFQVVIMTTRATSSEGQSAIRNWLMRYGYKRAMTVDITDRKVPAIIYIDDRAMRFDGEHFPPVRELAMFTPWNAYDREKAARGETA
jgi:hypothetical protein